MLLAFLRVHQQAGHPDCLLSICRICFGISQGMLKLELVVSCPLSYCRPQTTPLYRSLWSDNIFDKACKETLRTSVSA